MRAGQLRQRITIQSKTTSQNGAGEPVETWATFHACWAKVSPLKGREYLEAATQQQAISHRVEIRHKDGITPEMQVLFGSRVLVVESVQNVDERGINDLLMCREML